MDQLVNLLREKDILLGLFTIVFSVVYAYAATRFFKWLRRKRDEEKSAFLEAVSQGLMDDTLHTLQDFANIYKGVHGLSSEDFSYRYGLVRQLRMFLVDLVMKKTEIKAKDRIVAVKDVLTRFISEIEESEPFAGLPNAERTLITDISRMIESGDTHGANQKVKDIAGLIEARQEELALVSKANKWAIPLAIIGTVFTLVFGFVSVFK
ncbi:hypothetical protein C3F09_05710 [candidate division GN15 bacterium]|uniref:Uncharacterized protein n=1 Tax=candidate division GN15 bacterium TaxID=2072418 RepID=A0A855X3A7_9BACT|nr:MAG: hypothetical protein C3F09_05710 [candidate division GN15 bacterium]